jgi:NAD-dependent DNA ligase
VGKCQKRRIRKNVNNFVSKTLSSLSGEEKKKVDSLTKEQILQLRSTLYRLNQKKNLTKKEELLKEKLLKKLKNLDETLGE